MEENEKEEAIKGRTSFLKKLVIEAPKKMTEREIEQQRLSRPVHDGERGIVFVNGNKYRRAQRIIALIQGNAAPTTENELVRKEHYTKQLIAQEIDPKSDNALPAIYEIMGGLIRTPKGQAEAEEKAVEMQKKGKKRMIDA